MRKLRHEEIPRLKPGAIEQRQRHPIVVVVDNVRSIHNVGSFFRTADGAWIEKLVLTGISGTPDNRALHKTALGAQDTIPWEYVPDPVEAVAQLKASGYRIYALELTDSPVLYSELKIEDFPLVLIIGNELTGVNDALMAQIDGALEVPQYGTKQSLNVSVATGIALFDLVRHYRTLNAQPALSDPFPRPLPESNTPESK